MARVERSVTIDAPVEKVFSYLTDLNNQLEWVPSMTDVRGITGQEVGQKFGWTYKFMGIPFKGESEIIERVTNQRSVVKSKGGIASTWSWTFRPENDQTVVNMVVEYTIPVPVLGKVGERLVLRQNEREADLAMANVKERLEG
jgi:uncharacterized membrane protein